MGIKFTPASAAELAERGVQVEQPEAGDAKTPADAKPEATPADAKPKATPKPKGSKK